MITLLRTDANNDDFRNLVKALDADLAVRDGDDHPFYDQFNKLDSIQYAVVGYIASKPIACGAIKKFADHTMEIKRMYVLPSERGKGIASFVLGELEKWAKEIGCNRCVLETGINQPEAIRLYEKNHYRRIENYGQYAGVATSLCFDKIL